MMIPLLSPPRFFKQCRFTLRIKLFLLFAIICAIFTTLGLTTHKALLSNSQSVEKMLAINKTVKLADEGKITLAKTGQLPKDIEISTTGIDELGSQATTLRQQFLEIGKQLEQSTSGDQERQLAKDFIAISTEFYDSIDAFIPIRKKMLSYTADYQQRNRPLPDIINERELGHVRFIRAIKDSIEGNKRLSGGLDTAGCGFYQWYSQTKFEDEDITEVFEEIHPLHDKLHKYARQIDDKIAAGDLDGARVVFTSAEKDLKTLGLFFSGLGKLVEEKYRTQQDQFNKQMAKVNEIYGKAELAANALQQYLNESTLRASLTEMHDVSEASKKRMSVFVGLGLVLSILIAIYVGFMMHGFGKSLSQMVHRLHENAELFISMSEQLLANADNTEQLVESTNHNIVDTTENISSLAASSEEINAAIYEISSNSVNSAGIAKEATDESAKAAVVVDTLQLHADSISDVSKIISNIAFQTKLLALNANVEAARAGEAGAGFAIVANEVKNLAQSANNAAEEISQKIITIQEESKHASAVMKNISAIIVKISENSSSIAASVEEESAVVSEISNRISGVAGLADEMSAHIREVSVAAKDTKDHSVALQQQAETLSVEAEELNKVLLKL